MNYVAMMVGVTALIMAIIGIKKDCPIIQMTGQLMGVATLALLYLITA